jgi:hypothetical protein
MTPEKKDWWILPGAIMAFIYFAICVREAWLFLRWVFS